MTQCKDFRMTLGITMLSFSIVSSSWTLCSISTNIFVQVNKLRPSCCSSRRYTPHTRPPRLTRNDRSTSWYHFKHFGCFRGVFHLFGESDGSGERSCNGRNLIYYQAALALFRSQIHPVAEAAMMALSAAYKASRPTSLSMECFLYGTLM